MPKILQNSTEFFFSFTPKWAKNIKEDLVEAADECRNNHPANQVASFSVCANKFA
jgi:hypothetical protein